MRNLILPILCLIFTASYADIIRVNNNSGISADYSNLQTAIDSANSGDTIYLEPSSATYGNVTVSKQVSIYGPGYFLAENTGQQANLNTCRVNIITMGSGSAFSSVSGIVIANYMELFTGNIAITRCYFSNSGTSIYFAGTSSNTNVLFAQNYIIGSISHSANSQNYTVYWRNNYIGGTTLNTEGPGIVNDFTNNVINCYSYVIENSSFTNNIFTSTNNFNLNVVGWNNGFENNIFRTTSTPVDTALGNIVGVATNTGVIFTGGTTDGRFQILPGSLADDTGKEIPSGTPTDIGMYGGPNPYKLSGVPAIPTIYDLVVPTSNTTGGLNVTIKAKSQD
ncbi:hypothetical protein HZR84_10780 [Hyphobacterium sp. CCMP332]|nr:hypothetical protein HZR84_10780 [Hyphobacterium sp. CCMP332]